MKLKPKKLTPAQRIVEETRWGFVEFQLRYYFRRPSWRLRLARIRDYLEI